MSTPTYLKHYRGAFETFLASRTDEPHWMTELRRSAFQQFEELGLPSRKVEEWKYTSLRGFSKETFAPSSPGTRDIPVAPYEPIARMACTDGHIDLGQSDLGRLNPEVVVRPLGEAWEQAQPSLEKIFDEFDNGFAALLGAFLQGGAVIDVGRDVQLDAPIEFVRQTTADDVLGVSVCLIDARRLSEVSVVERFVGEGDTNYLSGAFTHINVEEGATLDHVIIQRESESAYHYQVTSGTVRRDAHLRTFNASLGSSLSRDDLSLILAEPGGDIQLNALYVGHDKQHLDHATEVDHVAPHTTSDQLYKTVLDDASHGAFAGTVFVRRDAQKINAEQLNNNMLLTDKARIDTKPQLEVGADDVECGHGATIGQLEDEELFYMNTRGLSPRTARTLLINGYAAEVVLRIANRRVRDSILHEVKTLFEDRME